MAGKLSEYNAMRREYKELTGESAGSPKGPVMKAMLTKARKKHGSGSTSRSSTSAAQTMRSSSRPRYGGRFSRGRSKY